MNIDMELYDAKYFRIFHQNENLNILKDIENTMNNMYATAQKFYNMNIEKTDIYVFNNQVKFQQLKDPTINEANKIDWWVGETMGKDILAVSPSLNIQGHNYQSILGVFAHEFIHTVNNKINKNCNTWIDEGTALYLANGDKTKDILEKYKIPDIQIFKIVREAGYRTKIAVYSLKDEVDPVGACVGQKGNRIQNVIKELEGEKIDILKYSADPREFIRNAMIPAKIEDVVVTDVEKKKVIVIVDESQLSFAIGKRGLNIKLANELTDWDIEVKSEAQAIESGTPKPSLICQDHV